MANTLQHAIDSITDNPRHREGELARTLEQETAKLPSDTFLWAAVTVMAASFALQLIGKKHLSLFLGQWTAPFLLFGVYNKIVKVAGHDQEDNS